MYKDLCLILQNSLIEGLKDSVLVLSNGAMSHNGPWKQVYTTTQVRAVACW